MVMDTIKDLLAVANETGFVLFFAVYMLLRHDKTVSRLATAVEKLTERIAGKTS